MCEPLSPQQPPSHCPAHRDVLRHSSCPSTPPALCLPSQDPSLIPECSLFPSGLPRLSSAPAAGREAGAGPPPRLCSVWASWVSILLDTRWIHLNGPGTGRLHSFPAAPGPSGWPSPSPTLEARGPLLSQANLLQALRGVPGGGEESSSGHTRCSLAGEWDLDPSRLLAPGLWDPSLRLCLEGA